ncbi:Copper amine oxidase N-terminal domain-containing protein [Thermoanaerobacter thermohydrosulfuricus]|uniref:Copper amine oxidase N-terminal domain-containing protein n=1 Tax=Thermoanaerobacter thermohydrosulfuricus TaxID=1516 RepID=A0A1G7QBM4_THETY|nr:Copper amine oxidase N-terminal domain-containing protein [Thermoanaerobacter thermohydrosulfuricus]SFE65785.1 Copper amine oxidase N-terminal domain-containing protein [Thermoanaerobacter thermohydrosulfuricus]
MKKRLVLVISAILMVSFFTVIAFANSTIKLIVNGSEIKPDVPPQIINGRTMVPIKWVAEAVGAEVKWDKQDRIVTISFSDKVETDLISNYLRTAETPKHFVENFAHALQDRNGAVARLFLSPKIRGQIKPEIIGPSTPVTKIEIKEVSYSNYYWVYNVKAYYGPYDNNSPTLAFEIKLTVEPERYPDCSVVSSRYFITKLDWINGKTEFIPN